MKANIYIASALCAMALTACEQMNEAVDAPEVQGLTLDIDLKSMIEEPITYGKEMTIKMDNYTEGLHYEKTFSGGTVTMEGIVPGVYTINVAGRGYTADGDEFILAGSSVGSPLLASGPVTVNMKGAVKGKLVFSEIYYCGSKPPAGFAYFRDQFYEIANNSDEVQYLDGLYFANLETIDFNKTKPVWPSEDGDKYIYAERVWRIPGTGKDYPLRPGESAVISQFAANHKLDIYNPNSPVDCSASEFEFNMNNVNFPDQPAVDMLHVFYNGNSTMTGMQYLTSVFGTAYCIFRVPEGDTWDPVNNKDLQVRNGANPSGYFQAKIPVSYIVDAVEGIRNETYVDAKNMPAVVDAGFVTMGGTYLGKGITRKVEGRGAGGAVFYQDTNNSTDDFEVGVVPVLHRTSTMPSWNHSLTSSN